MRNFAEAAFEPETIEAMSIALECAIAKLPEPIGSSHVTQLAESILRTAKAGERRVDVLERIANSRLPRGHKWCAVFTKRARR
jgi:hypothetical protein